jgi:site-specific recombinase XerD
MFEDIFEGPIARARQLAHFYAAERRQFLDRLKRLGYARTSLRSVACELIIVANRLDLAGASPIDITTVEAAARRWAADQVRRGRSTSPRISERNFRYWGTEWLRYWGRLTERPPAPPPPFGSLLDGFRAYMANEQGLTPLSIRSHAWKTEKFDWYWLRGRAFADATLQDIDQFLIAKGTSTWSRRSVSIAVQALRAFFRYAEWTHQCRAGIAVNIYGPRLYDLETLPSGPAWTEVKAILASLATDRPADIRRRAALLLFATYGFRLGEVAGLTLDDLDWEHNLIRIRWVKRRDVQTYPLSTEAGTALLRYLREVRPRGHWRKVFLTLQAPHHPLPTVGSTIWRVAYSVRAVSDCAITARTRCVTRVRRGY